MGVLKSSTVWLAVAFIMGSASGCSPGSKASDAAATPPPPPPARTVFDPLTQSLDRARGVQKTVDENADATRKAVDNQERGDNPP